MLMRNHWGLGVGHAYSHVRDGTTRQTNSQSASAMPQSLYAWCSTPNSASEASAGVSLSDSRTPLLHFDDLDNDFSPSDLEWEPSRDYPWNDVQSELGGTKCASLSGASGDHSVQVPDRFQDLDTSFSLADLDTLEWELVSQDENGDSSGSDNDGEACHIYEMYGLDSGGEELD